MAVYPAFFQIRIELDQSRLKFEQCVCDVANAFAMPYLRFSICGGLC